MNISTIDSVFEVSTLVKTLELLVIGENCYGQKI